MTEVFKILACYSPPETHTGTLLGFARCIVLENEQPRTRMITLITLISITFPPKSFAGSEATALIRNLNYHRLTQTHTDKLFGFVLCLILENKRRKLIQMIHQRRFKGK